jgi:hypothetical protein
MKKFLLGLCILGLTNLISAQNDLAMATANDNDITIKTSKIKNESYLMSNTNETKQLAVRIKKLQKIAAAYDISKESIYSKKKSITYDVVFEANENYIKAVYDHNGVIISSEEYYEDVRIPYVLTSQLAKDYPGWSFDKSNCKIFYSKERASKFTYKIVLKKGNKSKLITR